MSGRSVIFRADSPGEVVYGDVVVFPRTDDPDGKARWTVGMVAGCPPENGMLVDVAYLRWSDGKQEPVRCCERVPAEWCRRIYFQTKATP